MRLLDNEEWDGLLTYMGYTVGWFRPMLADKLENLNYCQLMHSTLSVLQLLFYAIPICRFREGKKREISHKLSFLINSILEFF